MLGTVPVCVLAGGAFPARASVRIEINRQYMGRMMLNSAACVSIDSSGNVLNFVHSKGVGRPCYASVWI